MSNQRIALTLALVACAAAGPIGCGSSRKVEYSVPKLVKSLKDKDPNVRYWAVESLGHYGPEAHVAIPDLIGALKDDQKMVRMGAAYALAEMGPAAADAVTALQEVANDAEKEVRDAAVYALKQLQQKKKAKPG
jgi:HEAT repeat protein